MYRIGLDIGGTGIQMGIVDEKGHILERGELVTNTLIPFSEQIHQMARCAMDMVERVASLSARRIAFCYLKQACNIDVCQTYFYKFCTLFCLTFL